MSQWDSAIKSPWECTLPQVGTLPSRLVPQLWSSASYLAGPLVSSSGVTVIAVLRPVLFLNFAPSNYTVTQTTHTYFIYHSCSMDMGNPLKLWKCVIWKPKMKTFKLIPKKTSIPSNIRINIHMVYMLFICQGWKRKTSFDLDVIQIEHCVNIMTHPEHHFNMHNNVKQDHIGYS